MSSVCDYFVIASGTSTTQVRAIADNIARQLKENGERIRHMEGAREALWILLDCGDVVCHIFLDQTRRFYDLERLWSDAPQTRFKEIAPKGRPKTKAKARKKVTRKKVTRKKVARKKVARIVKRRKTKKVLKRR
jgi:ribosome-associated protein